MIEEQGSNYKKSIRVPYPGGKRILTTTGKRNKIEKSGKGERLLEKE